MLINKPMSREAWRKWSETFRAHCSIQYVPEYRDDEERGKNYRYYR